MIVSCTSEVPHTVGGCAGFRAIVLDVRDKLTATACGEIRLGAWRTHASSRASTVAAGALELCAPAAAAHTHTHATAHAHATHGAHAASLQVRRLWDLCPTNQWMSAAGEQTCLTRCRMLPLPTQATVGSDIHLAHMTGEALKE